MRGYLNEPHRLFRRVRDEKGQLRLSKAAQAYHPGQGVYRSSYKNALRLTATENNMAYRTADHERWNDLDFVIGIEIKLSGNHPIEDICDEMCGVYPKTFKFVGWHPFCRCYAVPKLADEDEFIARQQALIDGEDVPQGGYTGEVTEMPQCFTDWVEANEVRIEINEKLNNIPYFLKDNREYLEEARRIIDNGREYDRLKSNPDYQDVEYNRANGGLKATHKHHEKHTKVDRKRLAFGNMTPWDLEQECQNILFSSGFSCILNSEQIFNEINGKQQSVLDTTTNGKEMDIISITENGENTIRNALERKKKQIRKVNELNQTTHDSLIMHFHDYKHFNEEKVRKGLGMTIKKIICAINSNPFKIIIIK